MSFFASGEAVTLELDVFDSSGAAVTGLTDGAFTKLLSRNGVTSAVTVTVAEVGSGRYSVAFTPNATGQWTVTVRHATYAPRGWKGTVDVRARDPDDLAFPTVSGRSLDVDASGGVEVGSFQTGSLTSAAFAAGAIDAAAIATDALGALELAADAVAEIADAVWDEARAGHVAAGSFGQGVASVVGSVGSVAAGGIVAASFGAGAIDAAAIAADAIGASELAAAACNKVADHALRRALANARSSSDGDAANFRSLLGAASKLVNKVAVSGGTLTVYQEDDATSYGSQTVTADAAANPITGLDTA